VIQPSTIVYQEDIKIPAIYPGIICRYILDPFPRLLPTLSNAKQLVMKEMTKER
jgi:hypothetical protein